MKNPIQSKTLWFSLAVMVLGIWDNVSPVLPEHIASKILIAVGPLFAFLRFITNQPLKFK